MLREDLLNSLRKDNKFDVIVIGGGATGLGTAFDAINRGYKTLLVERRDFAKVTSSKSTKLIHGGVRYLAQGNVALVKKALGERQFLYEHAPHIVKDMPFVLPCYSLYEIPYYFAGLKMYDILSGMHSGQSSKISLKNKTIADIPFIKQQSLKGSVVYHDGTFDDTRLAISLAQGIIAKGGLAINYMEATDFIKNNNKISGIKLKDTESNEELFTQSNCIINATGVFVDELSKKDNPQAEHIIKPSQGVHLILKNKRGFNVKHSMLVPKTRDGRILFMIPWYDNFILGTTDTPMTNIMEDATALKEEVDFIIETANGYVEEKITYNDIISVYAGQRPLIDNKQSASTKKLSRDEKVVISSSGLITVAGGKWTTYRAMAEHVLNFAIENALLKNAPCITKNVNIYGYTKAEKILKLPFYLRVYGSKYEELSQSEGFNIQLHQDLPYNMAQVHYAIEHEYARTIEDILARRTRALFINAQATIEVANKVMEILKQKLNKDDTWGEKQLQSFKTLANTYLVKNYVS